MKKLSSFFVATLLLIPLSVYGGMGIGGHGPTYGGDPAKPGTVSELKLDHTTETLNADKIISITDNPVLFFDCNGTDRNVTLPPEAANSTDLAFTIVNVSDGADEDLVIRDDTPTTLKTIGPEQGERVSCDGTTWEIWFNNGIRHDGIGQVSYFSFQDTDRWYFSTSYLGSVYASGAILRYIGSSATNPSVIPYKDDSDTGIGRTNADQLSLIAGGYRGMGVSESDNITETETFGRVVFSDTTFAFTTDGNLTDPLVSSVYLLDGDNDGDNDTISLLDGETAGQLLYLIAHADIDANDIVTIGMTHTTCTNCPTIIFNKVGENVQLMWTGSTWVVTSPVQDAL